MPILSEPESTRMEQAFDRFRAAPLRPPRYTADRARRTVRNRRRARLAAGMVAAALTAVIPVALHAITDRQSNAVNRTAEREARVVEAPVWQAPDLRNAAMEIPSFIGLSCPDGRVTFSDGVFRSEPPRTPGLLRLGSVAEVDALKNGTKQLAVVVRCERPASVQAVLLVERTAERTLATRGTVVSVDATRGAEISNVRAGANGTIDVELRLTKSGRQVRTFGWNGSRFVQVAGPVPIPAAAPATDLTVSASDVIFSAPVNERRSATLRVTVANNGPRPVNRIRLTFVMRNLTTRGSPTPEAEEWRSHCTIATRSLGDDTVTCEYPGPAAGASVTYNLVFHTRAEIGLVGGIFDYHQLTVAAVDRDVKTDSNPLDNAAAYQIGAA